MTDHHAGYIITLEDNIREDDAQRIMQAIAMVKGVIKVEPVIADSTIAIATARAKRELQSRLWEALSDD